MSFEGIVMEVSVYMSDTATTVQVHMVLPSVVQDLQLLPLLTAWQQERRWVGVKHAHKCMFKLSMLLCSSIKYDQKNGCLERSVDVTKHAPPQ